MHRHNKLYDGLSKLRTGPGGINCPCQCCNPKVGFSDFKKAGRRMFRRIVNMKEIREQLKDIDNE